MDITALTNKIASMTNTAQNQNSQSSRIQQALGGGIGLKIQNQMNPSSQRLQSALTGKGANLDTLDADFQDKSLASAGMGQPLLQTNTGFAGMQEQEILKKLMK